MSKNNIKYHRAKSKGIALELLCFEFEQAFFRKILRPKTIPADIYLLHVDNGNTGTMELCSKITRKTPTRGQ